MRSSFLFVLGAILLAACRDQSQVQMLPNIVLILADDMGYSDLGCSGSEIPTPNLDRLAADGLLMPHFYNAAKCCPTRAALLTGLYPHQAGMGDMVEGQLWRDSSFLPAYQGWLHSDALTLAEALQRGGYQTLFSGKWHLGNDRPYWPDRRGFERNFAMLHGAGNYFNAEPWITEDQFMAFMLDGKPFEPGEDFYITNDITDYALDFLRSANDQQPFFLYLSYTAPHWPLHAPAEEIEPFRGQYMEGWDIIRRRRFERMKSLDLLPADMALPPAYENPRNPALSPAWDTLSTEERAIWDLRMAVYAAQIHIMDRNIGRVLEQLEKQGQLDNTLIIFLSDNGGTDSSIYRALSWVADRSGPIGSARSFDAYGAKWGNVSNTPYSLFKSTVAEGGIKTPLIVHYPREIAAGSRVDPYAHVIDIFPTCLEAAGLDPASIYRDTALRQPEGISLWPLWRGETPPDPDRPLLWEHHDHWAARRGPWKLLHTDAYRDGRPASLELFKLDDDPAETRNLIDRYPDRARALESWYRKKAEEIGVEPFDSLILARSL